MLARWVRVRVWVRIRVRARVLLLLLWRLPWHGQLQKLVEAVVLLNGVDKISVVLRKKEGSGETSVGGSVTD